MKRIFFGLIVAFLLNSCKDRWLSAFEKINDPNLRNVPVDNWIFVQEMKDRYGDFYTVKALFQDTSYVLFFYESIFDGSVNIQRIRKRFSCEYDTCHLEMDSKDTLYFYKENPSGIKDFVVGEYAYRFERLLLDSVELEIYLNKEDSLRKLRGNNLPKLNIDKKNE